MEQSMKSQSASPQAGERHTLAANSATDSTSNDERGTDNSQQEKQNASTTSPPTTEESEHATGLRLFLIMLTIFVSTLLTALEIGIIATAIPGITDEFHSLSDLGWYGSATFLLAGASSPMWGKLYKYLNVQRAYLGSIALYLVGSVVAAAAPNSVSVIIGRALQGFGGSGILSGSVLVIKYVAPARRHPVLISGWMGVYMVSTILGPVIGGVFTSEVSWRWCFWINLPLGGPIVVLVLLFLRQPNHVKPTPATWQEIVSQLDLPGFALLLASLVCLTLAMQWGGQTKAWNDGSVVATLVLWVIFTVSFFTIEWLQGLRAMIPLTLLKPRMTWSNVLYCYISTSAMYLAILYLPIYLQSIHGQSAITSGVNTLPFLAFFAFGAMVSGALIGKTRLFQPYQLMSGLLMTAGMALIYTLEVDSSKAKYLGSQVLFGFGVSLGNQVPMTVVQSFSELEDLANSTGIMLMCQSISGAYFLVFGQCVFANIVIRTLQSTAPFLDIPRVLGIGASELRYTFSGEDLDAVVGAYMIGIKDIFAFSIAGSGSAALLGLVIPFKKLPDHGSGKA